MNKKALLQTSGKLKENEHFWKLLELSSKIIRVVEC